MDIEEYCDRVVAEIEPKLATIAASSRLERLLSYYITWRIPRHPSCERLHGLVCRIADVRVACWHSCDVSQLDVLFDLSVAEADEHILEHCRRHYAILREIQREIGGQ